MSFGKMNSFIEIVTSIPVKDSEGFSSVDDDILASIRVYKEDRHANEKWANMATFSEATSLFRFRKLPEFEVTTDNVIICADGRYNILSVEDVRGRGMYIEVLAKKVSSGG